MKKLKLAIQKTMPNRIKPQSNKVLFATTEVFPIIKAGGLADVSAGLPHALYQLGLDIKIVLPAYAKILDNTDQLTLLKDVTTTLPFRILAGQLEAMSGASIPIWFVDMPHYFNRPGSPYVMDNGEDWPDNADRFAGFCRAIYALALNHTHLDWQPDIVHCNDWPTGLATAFIARHQQRPATVFTIHNLAYQGLFSHETFVRLGLPHEWWTPHALEFHNQLSFIKGGLEFADMINTVSPTYANEILTPPLGNGLDGLLNHRRQQLCGILNGVDYRAWNPAIDPNIPAPYQIDSLVDKVHNKIALQQHFNLAPSKTTPLIGMISRIVEQKGFDLVLAALPELFQSDVQVIILGSGQADLEQALTQAAQTYPKQLGLSIGYSEKLAHLIEAGADMFLMPSRFEPCGLNQIYSLRYGTVPIVHHTGGLVDTVIDTNNNTLTHKIATGFHFHQPSSQALMAAITRALHYYYQPMIWQQIVTTGMQQEFSWTHTAQKYLTLYQKAQECQ